MKKSFFFVITVLTISTFSAVAQNQKAKPKPAAVATKATEMKWLTLEEAIQQNQKEPRKIFVDMYTDWCGWCKVMDKNTFRNAEVVDYASKKYYAVKFNPEKDGDVQLGNTTFKTMINGKVTGYPTTVVMDEKLNLIQPIAGYLEPRMFHQMITYFGGNNHEKEPFDKYQTGTYAKLYAQ